MTSLSRKESSAIKMLWDNPEDTFAIVYLTLFLDRFGTEGLEWDPSTITLEVEKEFDVDLKQLALDKLMVAIHILTSNNFHKSTPDFISFCNVLNGEERDANTFDPADAEDVAWGITEALIIYPPDDEDPEPFTDEIRTYIGDALDKEGIINPPDILRIALRTARVAPSIEDFSDDPEMFSAIYDVEAGKTDDINKTIARRLSVLKKQLQSLRLINGDASAGVELLDKLNRR